MLSILLKIPHASYIVFVVHGADVAILYGRHLLMVMTEN